MQVKIIPSEIEGTVVAPPSKSYTHRALFIGLLTKGESRLVNPLISNDTKASLNAIRLFGARATWTNISSTGKPIPPHSVINCSNSGTTARIATAIGAIVDGITVIDGSKSLRMRPMEPIIDALKQIGVKVYSNKGALPIEMIGSERNIKNHYVKIRGDISSQFITALLLLAPKIGLHIEITTELKSRPYIEITIKMLKESGIKIDREGTRQFFIEEQDFKARTFKIPGDFSLAAFILAAGALYGKVRVSNLSLNDIQGDKRIVEILREMDAKVLTSEDEIIVEKNELIGITVNCSDIPDLVPVLAILGAFATGKTVIYGAEHLKFKETNRINVLYENLKKMGISVEKRRDGLVIQGKSKIRGRTFDSYGDHRIAMALTIAALGAEGESIILNADSVRDSYPAFFAHLRELGGSVIINDW